MPERVASALDLNVGSPRGRAEARVGLGGTYAGLGAYGLLRGGSAQRAVGAAWLGAAVTRAASLRTDEPSPDWTFWAYLAGEAALGAVAMFGPVRRQRQPLDGP
jgi:hypothetical protein